MATATELTLTLGRTVYGGDPDSDERVQARETRVSVTWSLGEDEQDLTLTASVLAEEAERALAQVGHPCLPAPCENRRPDAVQQTHRPNGHAEAATRSIPASASSNDYNASVHSPAGHGHTGNGNGYQANIGTATASAQTSSPQATPVETSTPRYGGYIPPRVGTENGQAASGRDIRPQTAPTSPDKEQPVTQGGTLAKASTTKQSSITRAQCLAVHSHCTRRGIAQWEMLRLVAEHFGKRNLEDLDKNQGGELLNMLQQAEHEQRSGNPDYAN